MEGCGDGLVPRAFRTIASIAVHSVDSRSVVAATEVCMAFTHSARTCYTFRYNSLTNLLILTLQTSLSPFQFLNPQLRFDRNWVYHPGNTSFLHSSP
jgi:hypothetical protein